MSFFVLLTHFGDFVVGSEQPQNLRTAELLGLFTGQDAWCRERVCHEGDERVCQES